jgi:glycerol-3-phosphate O-acyltransferase/dihydroxyacetone phosphate acyltransferase
MHYWSKASLFANPIVNYILTSSGCIPVERKSKDRMVLFKGTFDTLRKDKVVALFPEGTSYTEPKIMQVKDGAAWAALEYAKIQRQQPASNRSKGIVIVPVAIVYTNKSKYRSDVGLRLPLRIYHAWLMEMLGFG